jgi:archaellum component FlaG (FlaF/FlaG flagellin family)
MKTSIAFTSALAISASLATTVTAFADEITLEMKNRARRVAIKMVVNLFSCS